jgi:hypothetical protein
MKGDYEEFHTLRRRKNKAKQTQSRLAPRPALGVEKTKPISKQVKWRYVSYSNGLRRFIWLGAAKKQTQFKAKQSQFAGLWPEILSTKL